MKTSSPRRNVLLVLLLQLCAVSFTVAADPMEIMVLTTWGDALERFWPSSSTYGVRYGAKDATSANQKWFVDTATNTVRSPDGYCLTAPDDWNWQNDLLVLLTRCSATPTNNQRWVYGADKTFQITMYKDGGQRTYCLDADASTRPQNIIHGWECAPQQAPNANQQWKIFYPGYQIKVGDKCLALAQSNRDDEPVRVVNCDNSPLQMWKYDFADGRLRLGDPASGVCLDSFPVGESGNVHMWTCDAINENQQVDFQITRADGTSAVSGKFFMRDTEMCLTLNPDGSKLVTGDCNSASISIFTLLTELPGDLCAGKTCQNGAKCVFGRCRCPEGVQGDDCGNVGKRMRVRASNGRFLTVDNSKYALEYALLDSDKRQQIWYHFPGTNMLKVNRRRMCLQGRGDIAELAVCRFNDASQRWVWDIPSGRLQLQNTNRCLDVDVLGASHTARVQDCTAAKINANQVWEELSPDATAFNSDMLATMIRHRLSLSLCWTMQNGVLITATCAATVNQLWNFNDFYSGAGALCSTELCAVAKASSGDANGLVTLASYDGQRIDQRFEYESATGQIRLVNSDRCIAKSSDGSNRLLLVACAAADMAQAWYIAKLDKCRSDDYLTMKDKCVMGKCGFGRCQCQPGFEGPTCAYNSCTLLQCSNGGTCVLGKCKCADGYTGVFCDEFIKCKGVKCINGGACSREGKCSCPVGFSGERCHIPHPTVLLRGLEYQAIGLEGGLVTTVAPDTRKKEHLWVWDSAKTMLRSAASSTMCLEQLNGKDLGVALCNATMPEQKWSYSVAKGKLATAAAASLVVGFEESVSGRYRPRLGSNFAVVDGNDLSFVEMDRLDLPGSSLRSNDRTKCLSASTGGAFSAAECSSDDEAQQWEYHAQNGAIKLPRLGAPVCLSAAGGDAVRAVKCNGDDHAQQFDFDFATKRFRNRQSGACLVLSASSLSARPCSSDVSTAPQEVLRASFRGFCDVINMCEGGGVCTFGRCGCPSGRNGAFCEVTVDAAAQ